MSAEFVARYSCPCGMCDQPINPGDDACYFENEVCHVDCVDG